MLPTDRVLLLAATALLILIGLADLPLSPEELHPGDTRIDAALTQGVIDHMRAGTGYYDAMETALRTQGYALRPFPAFRLPLLAKFTAMFPTNAGPPGVADNLVAGCLADLDSTDAIAMDSNHRRQSVDVSYCDGIGSASVAVS